MRWLDLLSKPIIHGQSYSDDGFTSRDNEICYDDSKKSEKLRGK